MDDEHAELPGRLQYFVHARCHFRDAGRGPLAPMLVPHVANDHGRVMRIPLRLPLVDREFAARLVKRPGALVKRPLRTARLIGGHARRGQGAQER